MARYIDVDIDNLQVSDYIEVWNCNCSENGEQTVMAVDDLQYLPAADVQEVKHGKWIHDNFECSVCGGSLDDIMDADSYFAIGFDGCDYCPWCGAKMDGYENEK